jgi:hypothetical protein
MAQANKARWLKWREDECINSIYEFESLKDNPLFIAGIMLYWAEGDGNLDNANTRLTNTDPRMVRMFIDFALQVCNVPIENVKIGLIIYPDIIENVCKEFWNKYLGIPFNQFYKTQLIEGKIKEKKLEHGICMVRIGGTALKIRIHTWINLYVSKMRL